jgi:glycosyltransferase involved in cell wall biosynthesis
MKIYYLSISTFADNQLSLLHHLAENAEITYGLVIPNKRANYTAKELTDYCDQHNIPLELFPLKYRFRDPRVINTYLEIVRSIRQINPDIIYFTNFDQIYINLLLLTFPRDKVIIGFHDVENHSKTRLHHLTNLGKTVLFRYFRYFLTYSQSQSEILQKKYPRKKVFTIPLPLIGFGETTGAEQTREAAGKITRFLFFGNILHYKGLDILLRSINRLSKKYTNFRLTIAGRTDEWQRDYENLLENKALLDKQIRFIRNDEIPGFFAAADYVVLPYRDTTQSGPLMISYHYNVPVIASNAIGFREFIEPGKSGYMFDLDTENDLDRVLEEAILRPEADYQALKKNQKAFVDAHFTMNRIVRKYLDMFSEVHNRQKKHFN